MSTGEDENVPPQENGQFEPFFITEDVEASLSPQTMSLSHQTMCARLAPPA